MPEFLAAFPPVAHLPYLPDVARLDWPARRPTTPSDAAPLDPAVPAPLHPKTLEVPA